MNLLLLISSFAFTIYNVKNNSEFLIGNIENQKNNSNLVSQLSHSANQQSITLLSIINEKNTSIKALLIKQLEKHRDDFSSTQTALMNKKNNNNYTDLNNLLKTNVLKNIESQNKVIKLSNDNKIDEAKLEYITESLIFKNDTSKILDNIAALESDFSEKNNVPVTSARETKVLASQIGFFLFTVLVSILLARFLIKKQNRNNNRLTTIATTDSLTNLTNRFKLTSILEEQIEEKPSEFFAVVFLDIDHFKDINDTYGHEIGDDILMQLSTLIQTFMKEDDIVARFGGDEFVLLLRNQNTKEEVLNFIEQLSLDLETSFMSDDNEIFITTSMGISVYPESNGDANTLMKNADIAMYNAKKSGRNTYKFFSETSAKAMEEKYKLSQKLRSILKNENPDKELYMHYQPLFDVNNNKIKECEALIRWKNLEGEAIQANDFIPLAEETNLIEKINLFVINEACKQQQIWKSQGIDDVRININLSGSKVIFSRLLKKLISQMELLALEPKLFGIEITERTLFDINEDTVNELKAIRNKGIKISIDDFGTGYSSLSYLKTLPLTTLKIDKAFVDDLAEDKDDQALVKAIITLGQSLKLDIVAEGVETIEQYTFLKENGCNTIQGFYFYRPMASDSLADLAKAA